MFGDDVAALGRIDQQSLPIVHEGEGSADKSVRYRVAGRGLPYAGELVDFGSPRWRIRPSTQRWIWVQHSSFDRELLSLNAEGVAVAVGVNFNAPPACATIGCIEIQCHVVAACGDLGFGPQRTRQDRIERTRTGSPRSRSIPGRRRGRSPVQTHVVGGKPRVGRRRHKDVRHDPSLRQPVRSASTL